MELTKDAPTGDTILEMVDITKTFPGVKALSEVTFRVKRGEVHAICGENGAGKSTLMKVLSGVYPHGSYDGEIKFEGKTAQFKGIRDSEAEGIVIIHQELALSPYLSIAENIFLGNERASRGVINWHKTNGEASKLLKRVGLKEGPDTKVVDIGVGKQQLVEIAKALSKDVKLLILDEPTAALNDDDSAHLLGLIRTLREEGITCIIISHKLNEIAAIADSTTIIRDGQTIKTLDMHGAEPVTEEEIIRLMVGRSLDNRYPDHVSNPGSEVLRLENWTVHSPLDPNRVVVDGADIFVRAGEIVGIAGLMGAGRTELAMSVFGKTYGSRISGQIFIDGKPVKINNVTDAIKAGLAYASEDRKRYGLNLIDDIKHNTTAAALRKISRGVGVVNQAGEYKVAEEYRRKLNTKTPTVDAGVGKLSGGNQQKVVLAKWMFTDPKVLILDEPTRGIDVGAKYEIYGHINALADAGKGVLVISSELPELLGICDRIYALSQGRITGEVPRAEATQERLMHYMTMEKEAAR
ncbi:multiple monosaccharide ABC transporter ATP-binding protein [Yimella sp. cx-51]|uniref:multiple monosaccharide ABC transporter ATP-binding protein n=1 Tax=Yimella sp. cx-51 TaxID=2770551 RepID=UPI00165E68BA|nr:multiple monosaccharide ABC transporter ATP-binding protein [Yimella sp. cx-51]MBC9956511.1 ATP-binding cassette domain-containing protein [Yimella sp. cx-51]QTH38382.1 ATP-binding cassette domain-containing protein [Yimella sp. cx-51]